jgi:hypothetical protein
VLASVYLQQKCIDRGSYRSVSVNPRGLRNDRKTGAAAYRRAKLDAMSDAVGRRSDDEQPEPEALRARRIEPEERLEYARQLIGRDASPVS